MVVAPWKLITVALAASIHPGPDGPSIQFTVPGAGSWQVMATSDLRSWRLIGTGYVRVQSHGTVRVHGTGAGEFYVVNWIPGTVEVESE